MANKNWNQQAAIINAIRRTFSRSPLAIEVLNEGKRTKPRYKKDGTRHKVDAAEYNCQVCNKWVNSTHIEVDHVIPVIPLTSTFYFWLDDYVKRLFCDKKNLQRICEECHLAKSTAENTAHRLSKDTKVLDLLEKHIRLVKVTKDTVDILKKEVTKYTSKTKPDEIRNRALKLRELVKISIKSKKRRTTND